MKKLLALVLACAMMFSIVACGSKESTDSGKTDPGSTETKKDLVVGVTVEPVHFTTFAEETSGDKDHIVLYNIYDTLLYKDTTDGSIKPFLAESWEMSEDGLQIKIKLREDVTFHNGNKFTADDVKFTYDTTKGYPVGKSLLVNYDYTEVIDDYNCIIHMVTPYTPILNSLCSRAACIMDKEYFDEVGLEGYKEAPVGTGAYKFVSAKSGDAVVLESYDEYWGGKPAYDTVTIKAISDTNSQILAVESGDVDVLLGAPVENVSHISGNKVAWDAVGSNATMFMTFNMTETSWVSKDLNFRKAVQAAIDKESLNMAVFSDQAELIDIFGSPAFTTRPAAGEYSTYEYDLDAAKAYLEASNYSGQEFEIVCTSGTANEKVTELVQGMLMAVGINAKMTSVDSATYYDIIRGTGEFGAYIKTDTSSVLDMDSMCNYFTVAKYDFDNMNYAGTDGETMDSLLVASRTEADPDVRLANITEVCSIVNENAYVMYLLVDVNTVAYSTDVQGVRPCMAKYYRFSEWS